MKKSFILYQDQRENFELLPDKECKELLMAIFDYPNNQELSPLAKLSFVSIKNQLKRDLDKWNNIMERNRINGKLGGRPKIKNKPKKPSGLSGNPKNPVNVNDTVTVNVNDIYLSKWNETFKTNYKSSKQIIKPLTEWLKTYPINDICFAVQNIKYDEYWKDKDLDPLWLLRFKDKNGDVDRIGKMLNLKTDNKTNVLRVEDTILPNGQLDWDKLSKL